MDLTEIQPIPYFDQAFLRAQIDGSRAGARVPLTHLSTAPVDAELCRFDDRAPVCTGGARTPIDRLLN
jgi:hypothetical protein